MQEEDKNFALEIIKIYGEDRFYHSCLRGSTHLKTKELYKKINNASEEQANFFFRQMGLEFVPSYVMPISDLLLPEETDHRTLCRIIYNLFKYKKEFAIKEKQLPDHLHARMMFMEKNEWVEKYIEEISS